MQKIKVATQKMWNNVGGRDTSLNLNLFLKIFSST